MSAPVAKKSQAQLRAAARLLLFTFFAIAILAFFAYDLQDYTTIASFKAQEQSVHAAYVAHPIQVIAVYMSCAVVFVLCCLPAASLVMMTGGAIFGLVPGALICSCALTIGAVLSLLSARFIFRDFVERKFKNQAAFVNRRVDEDGAFFLVTMRLLPMMPYFVTNLLFGLTKMPVKRFWYVSQLASLPAILVFANAGTALAKITSFSDILSPRLFLSLTLLALFPTLAKAGLNAYRRRGRSSS